ncbi:hexitol phosphatase HxpB [Acerihabitans arboris]|uniref:Hexitol phosphatase HxpB n=1 Tax=Acerihabitans arboris TaxID=2691583 RepID=A0A845SE28_9GAMM|nr:hexitol phosphatase HxpB [Acerihabitans arboris]NDL63050.1 hexitol phosphatase HxpB [Acerihabitans arboris]
MALNLPQQAVIFDMDGLIIDSEPLWHQAELDIFAAMGLDSSAHDRIPDTLGMRIDQVVKVWYQLSPWQGATLEEVTNGIIQRAVTLIDQRRPLLPGVGHALETARSCGLKIGMASASPLFMLENVLEMFNLRRYFDHLASAQNLPYSKPHPEVYLQAAASLGVAAERCTTLEDSFNGMIATKAARMRSIVVPDAALRADPRWAVADFRLASLEELTPGHIR